MPSKPKRPCRYLLCPQLTDRRDGYCAAHAVVVDKQYRSDHKEDEVFYHSAAWKSLRDEVRREQVWCQACLKSEGRYVPGEDVDHIVPRIKDRSLELSKSNMQLLCSRCHSRKTAAEKRNSGRW